jgi:UDP-N-acetylglucosamine--N-acetylmuramyl-(pentapeptide) pyrophosphoryl-undecaprenol N-acetylglucosamine transferase
MNKNIICFVAGKSGGHIIPCLTLALQKKKVQSCVLFFSTNAALDMLILKQHPVVSWHIPLLLSSIQILHALDYVRIPLYIVSSLCMSFYYLLKHRPTEIITTGGVVALPVCYVGFLLRIPITIYCLDAVPGKAIKALAPCATTIKVCFEYTKQFFKHVQLIPYPIQYTVPDTHFSQNTACEQLHLNPHKKTIVILGGSQGSSSLNNYIKQWIMNASCPHDKINIIHQTGSTDTTDWKALYARHAISAYVFSYQPNLASIYAAADLIICRAGAGTLFEIIFFKKKAIIIPLKTKTTTHQQDNACAISEEYPDLFTWIDQEDIERDPKLLFTRIKHFL